MVNKDYKIDKTLRAVTYGLFLVGLGLGGFILGERKAWREDIEKVTNLFEEYSINTQPKQITHIGDLDMNGREDVIIRDYLGRSFILFGQKDGSYLSLEEAESKFKDCPSELEEFRNMIGENILVKAILAEPKIRENLRK